MIPTFHPAAILHGGGEGSKQFERFREDFALIERTLEELREHPARTPAAADPAGGDTAAGEEQLELF